VHVFLQAMGQNQNFVGLFQEMARMASQRIGESLTSDREMFFTSTFCIDEKKMPELKKQLRSTILKFVDDSIQHDGNRTVSLITAFHL